MTTTPSSTAHAERLKERIYLAFAAEALLGLTVIGLQVLAHG